MDALLVVVIVLTLLLCVVFIAVAVWAVIMFVDIWRDLNEQERRLRKERDGGPQR